MKKYGLIGGALGHSYSKTIHEMIGDYSYELMPLPTKEEFSAFMEKRDFDGINVTIPYKRDVIPYLDHIDPAAEKIGAVNTIVKRDGKLYGYNTDYSGFLYSLKKNNIEITEKKVLVIGNGGAAKAVNAALSSLLPSEMITVKYKKEPGVLTYEEAAALHNDADVLVNTSPVGMFPNVDASPIDLTPYFRLSAVVDIIYNPSVTKLLKEAQEKGAKTVNGLLMLVSQAVYAHDHFTGKSSPDELTDEIYEKLSL
ncbi:MAG: shikimate dehydrogenase [Lachnospiraceae bacterium]|nr:shikimate dehydrogenase [Lachnospiraceae bacterium]MBR6274155.1 shikimate dehydrogenase [Lachnospiraceae bacterium]